MSMAQVAASVEDLSRVLLVIKGYVYDVKKFAKLHPGGLGPIFHGAGKDMTDQFSQFHPVTAWKRLRPYLVATVAVKETQARNNHPLQKDWDDLTQQILAEGLYETRYSSIAVQLSICVCFMVAALYFSLGYASDSTA